MASFGLSCGFTGGCYRCVFYCFMACGCDRFCACFLAVGAGVGLRSGCGAGCCFCHLSAVPAVTKRCCCGLSFEYGSADAAVTSFGLSCGLTGGCYRRVFHCFVACGCDCLCTCFLAAGTGVGLRSGCGAGRCFCYFSVIPAVSKCCCCGLGLEHGSADAAMASFCLSCGLTGGCYRCVFYCFVACGCDCFCACFLAAGTGVGLRSGCGAGRCFCYFSVIPTVSKRCCCGLGFDHGSADATMASFGLSCGFTGGCYRCVFYCFMACGCDRFCACFLAAGAGVSLRSGCGAGCYFCYFSAIPAVT